MPVNGAPVLVLPLLVICHWVEPKPGEMLCGNDTGAACAIEAPRTPPTTIDNVMRLIRLNMLTDFPLKKTNS